MAGRKKRGGEGIVSVSSFISILGTGLYLINLIEDDAAVQLLHHGAKEFFLN